jgi:hypothetical protein
LLIYSLFTGAENADFMWSYLGILQLITHFAALRIKYPISATLACKSLLSVSVLDISDIQASLLKNSFFDISKWISPFIDIIGIKN